MSLTIRLSRIGRKNQPAYKLVVTNTRDKRNGKYIEVLGFYNPFDPVEKFSYDKEKLEKWKKHGAFVTEAVNKLLENKYEYVKYEPKKAKKKEGADEGESVVKEESPKEAEDENVKEEKKEEPEVKEEAPEEPAKEEKGE